MALNKKIELNNGVTTTYHRIVSIQQFINQETIIEVASYTSKEKREEEKAALAKAREGGEYPETNIHIETEYIPKQYEEKNNNVQDMYAYLKTLEKFKGSKDE